MVPSSTVLDAVERERAKGFDLGTHTIVGPARAHPAQRFLIVFCVIKENRKQDM